MLAAQIMDGDATLHLPDWYMKDKKSGIAERELLSKLKDELYNEVVNRKFNMYLWTDKFIEEVAEIYLDHFNKIYCTAVL